jgi:lon-related putative ATP-dependent protease
MADLVNDLASEIPAFFESEEYQTQRRTIEEEYGQRQETEMAEFADRARAENIALVRTPMGFMLAAMRDGKVLKPEDYEKLPAEERAEIDEKIVRLQEELAQVMRNAPKLERAGRREVEKLNARTAERVVAARIEEVEAEFAEIEAVVTYLAEARRDLIENAELFLQAAARQKEGPFPEAVRKYHQDSAFDRYAVNVMVAHDDEEGAPVIHEDLPTLDHLTGRIEHVSQMGALLTNFTMIRPGALHRANGGYLVLDARQILREPYAWDALKRCLRSREITITSMAERMSLASTVSLEPEPIPLNVRVVLVGDRLLHALLTHFDSEFAELFKLQADFETEMDNSEEAVVLYSRVLATLAARHDLPALEAGAVALLLEEAMRMSEDTRKLSLRLGDLSEILQEGAHYAEETGRDRIARADIERAVAAREWRASRIEGRMQEAVARGTILIDTEDAKVGQINGLSVIGMNGHRFGRAARITARVRMGSGKLIDIEREVELGGPLHSKGVMILAGYLTGNFALDLPFSLHASLVFEQSYAGVEGDSASSAELYALLSALADLPIAQSLAVTGSVNQLGEVQAIGGVNEKIEGFFKTCRQRGLTGQQGVLIPAANAEHLMLREEVAAAAEEGTFHIVPVSTIDEGIEILTGCTAGARGTDGSYPADSVNGRVEARLREFAEARRAFGLLAQGGPEDGRT